MIRCHDGGSGCHAEWRLSLQKTTRTEGITYGRSSDNEMCFFVMFYYPFDALTAV